MKISVLIPTSPIPSHPETTILDETISNIRKYTDDPIIIMFDEVHESLEHRRSDYEQYKRNVLHNISQEKYGVCIPQFFTKHSHQAIMTRTVLELLVQTPVIMFCEHDTSPINEIPFNEMVDLVRESEEINYIRFQIFHMILPEHQFLMKEKIELNGIKLTRTLMYSQRPFIAKTSWYLDILNKYFGRDDRTMIEDIMVSVIERKYKEYKMDTFGLYLYTPDGNHLRSYTSDGRKDDPKIITG